MDGITEKIVRTSTLFSPKFLRDLPRPPTGMRFPPVDRSTHYRTGKPFHIPTRPCTTVFEAPKQHPRPSTTVFWRSITRFPSHFCFRAPQSQPPSNFPNSNIYSNYPLRMIDILSAIDAPKSTNAGIASLMYHPPSSCIE